MYLGLKNQLKVIKNFFKTVEKCDGSNRAFLAYYYQIQRRIVLVFSGTIDAVIYFISSVTNTRELRRAPKMILTRKKPDIFRVWSGSGKLFFGRVGFSKIQPDIFRVRSGSGNLFFGRVGFGQKFLLKYYYFFCIIFLLLFMQSLLLFYFFQEKT